ncbi:MAG: tetratricopeptide repeat protein, partial [Pedobacter sp.]|nr:tetratricopeptide repeat protein [Pedobacter sp.]
QKTYQELESKFGASDELKMAKQRLSVQNGGAANVDELSKQLTENPADIKNYLYLSGLLLEKNKNEEALSLLLKAKTIAPDQYEIDLALADAYKAQQKNELAMAALRSAFANASMPLENKIKIVSAMLPKFADPAVVKNATALAQAAEQVHPGQAKLVVLLGDVYYQQGNFAQAKLKYQEALKISDQLYVAWEKLLAIQTLLGQYQEAIKTGEDALAIYPNQAILYYYRAFALHRNGQNAEAGLEIKSALQLDGEDKSLKAMIFALQAEVFIDQEKLKEADAAFDKAIELAPDNYLTLSNYAYYLALRNQNLAKAEALAAKAATAMPNHASVLDTYAIVLFRLGKYDQALLNIQKALQNNEATNPVYLEHYGDILFMKGAHEQAVVQWQKAKQAGGSSDKLNKKINEKKYIK